MNKTDFVEAAAKIFCAFALIVAAFFLVKYVLAYILPFLGAWIAGSLILPTARRLSVKTHIPRKICSALIISAVLAVLVITVFALCVGVAEEAERLLEYLSDNGESVLEAISSALAELPVWGKLFGGGDDGSGERALVAAEGAFENMLASLVGTASSLVGSTVSGFSDALLTLTVTVAACYYFAIDAERINKEAVRILPESAVCMWNKFRSRLGWGFKRYFKAYIILFLITFAQLLVGFLILGIDYALVLSLVIAAVDFLPILGTAAVLIPWGIILLLTGNIRCGTGLLAMQLIMSLLRQLIEPKILGKSFGAHPVLGLCSAYIGYRVFGIWGLILAPPAVLIIASREHSANSSE